MGDNSILFRCWFQTSEAAAPIGAKGDGLMSEGGRLEEHQEGRGGALRGARGEGGGALTGALEEGTYRAQLRRDRHHTATEDREPPALCRCTVLLLLLLLHAGLMLAPTRATRRRRWNFVGRWNQCVLPPSLPPSLPGFHGARLPTVLQRPSKMKVLHLFWIFWNL